MTEKEKRANKEILKLELTLSNIFNEPVTIYYGLNHEKKLLKVNVEGYSKACEVKDIVCDYFKVPFSLILEKDKRQELDIVRKFICFICCKKLGIKPQTVGNLIARERTSVINQVKSLQNDIDTQHPETIRLYRDLMKLV